MRPPLCSATALCSAAALLRRPNCRKPFQSAHDARHATEEENSDTFFAYNAMVRAKDQVVAFNYLVEQQSHLMEKIGVAGPPDHLPMAHGMGL